VLRGRWLSSRAVLTWTGRRLPRPRIVIVKPREFELPGQKAIIRKEGPRLIEPIVQLQGTMMRHRPRNRSSSHRDPEPNFVQPRSPLSFASDVTVVAGAGQVRTHRLPVLKRGFCVSIVSGRDSGSVAVVAGCIYCLGRWLGRRRSSSTCLANARSPFTRQLRAHLEHGMPPI
jgi:virulence-associated protein VagC